MNFEMDIHTHTIISGHAYSTLEENIKAAQKKGLKLLGITEHASGMVAGAPDIYFCNYIAIPRVWDNMEVILGVEANIMDYDASLDLKDDLLKQMDIVIASMHPMCVPFGNIEQNTNAILKAMENKYVTVIGHPGDPRYPIDEEAVMDMALKTNTLVEINNASLNPNGFRKGSDICIKKLLNISKKRDIPIVMGSDAHISRSIADFSNIIPIFEELNYPKELILNTDANKFKNYIAKKRSLWCK